MKILFLASGNGGTMKFLHQALKIIDVEADIIAVIADRDCGAVEYAMNNEIPTFIFRHWKEETMEIAKKIQEYIPDIVVTNIHKILPNEIFSCCGAKFINLHYSLLPAFGGVIGFKTLEMAKEVNAQIIGATCHYVSEKVDAGVIISQAAFAVDWSDDYKNIGNRVFRIACESILNAILIITNTECGFSSIANNHILYSPKLQYDNSKFTDSFWEIISKL